MSSFSSQSVTDFLTSVAAKSPTPGGGAVASVVGALAAALAQMVVNYSVGKKNLAAHEPALRAALPRLEIARRLLLQLSDEDAAAYGAVNELSRLPETDARRVAELPAATKASVQVPMAVAAACVDLLRLFESLGPITNRHLRSDLAIAAVLADAAARSSRWNIAVNVVGLDVVARSTTEADVARLLEESARLRASVENACE